jgi:hypothetical protein
MFKNRKKNVFVTNNPLIYYPKETELLFDFNNYLTYTKNYEKNNNNILLIDSYSQSRNNNKKENIFSYSTNHFLGNISTKSKLTNSNNYNGNKQIPKNLKKFSIKLNKNYNNNRFKTNKSFFDENIYNSQFSLNNKTLKNNVDQIKDIILPEIQYNTNKLSKLNKTLFRNTISSKNRNINLMIKDKTNETYKFHELKVNYLLNIQIERGKKDFTKISNAIKEMRTKEEIEEGYDNFIDEGIQTRKLKYIIKKFLGAKDSKLNQIKLPFQPFFDVFENKVNFLWDVNLVPHIKNSFIDLAGKINHIDFYPNVISMGIKHYLCQVRYNLQKKKDDKMVIKKKEKKKEDFYTMIINNIKKFSNIKNEEKEKEKNNENILHKREEDEENILVEKEENQNIKVFDLENFFIHKYNNYAKTGLVNKKIHKIICNLNKNI